MARSFRAISSSELVAELREDIPQLQEISEGKVSGSKIARMLVLESYSEFTISLHAILIDFIGNSQ